MLQILPEEWKQLSHKKRRQLINKERRRRKRVLKAEEREEEQAALEDDPEYLEEVCAEERRIAEEERRAAAQSVLEEELWLKRERQAQEEFRRKREVEEKILREREERERIIREEWEALQKREKEEEERRAQEKRDKEERLQEALRVGDTPLHETSWASPRWAPQDSSPPPPTSSSRTHPPPPSRSTDYGTEQDPNNCSFYLKTGACRFKERCSKHHPRPLTSTTLLLPGMYGNLGFMEQLVDDRDQDVGLEYDEGDMYDHFKEFYKDVLPEFRKAGKVVQFKVSCNYEPHLRGNVYVQFTSEEECRRAYQMFNGRWYAQKQVSCEFCPVQKWRSAICGLFNMRRCFKGRHCNFLHVFRNPDREFFQADRDLPPYTPPSHTPRRHSSHDERRPSQQGSYRRPRQSRSRSKGRQRHRTRSSRSRSRSPYSRHLRYAHSRSRSSSRSRSPSRERTSSRYDRRTNSRDKRSERNWHRSSSKSQWGQSRKSSSRRVSRSQSRSPKIHRHRSSSSRSRSRSKSPQVHRHHQSGRRSRSESPQVHRHHQSRSRSRSNSPLVHKYHQSRSRSRSNSPQVHRHYQSRSRSRSKSPLVHRHHQSRHSHSKSKTSHQSKSKKRKHSEKSTRSKSRSLSGEETPLKESSHKKKHKKSKKKHSHHSSKDKEKGVAIRKVEKRSDGGQSQGNDPEHVGGNEMKETTSDPLEISKPESYTSEGGMKVHQEIVSPSELLEDDDKVEVFDNGSPLCSTENGNQTLEQGERSSAECVEEVGDKDESFPVGITSQETIEMEL